ncbi:protein kinase domain-containing protein [Cyanobium sp. Morenito 9A2]|uniref:protein kinase domain-containing protein n=1 Tax=Cyanobium sp. Morenito 9A2 TaxID=2823718 RepID=UPI0020CD50E7|nr:adenylate/guanylate cyclase domain-containing protein [Cyanobium sp. Morenito 9A2]MCP9849986.1 protein kinase [Cyanobium sp. Morenito 9A2]
MSTSRRHLKVVVFSDVVDSSERIFADELIAIQHIQEDLAFLQEQLQRHGGSLVKTLGDGLLATFDAPSQALEFVQEVSLLLSKRGQRSLQHRFGLHTGEIYADGDDILGQGVHLASRLQTISPANGVAFVQSTFEIIDDRFRNCAELIGNVNLHGFRRPMVCYRITAEAFRWRESGDQEASNPQAPDLLERLLEGSSYRPERGLSRSGGHSSFLVRDSRRDRLAVFKLFPVATEFLARFELEAACLERLRHPRIPRFIDAYAREGWFCLLQEYIAGPSLRGSLEYLGRPERVGDLVRQVLDTLEAAHGAGVIHGDINPANLILSAKTGQLILVDFALMKARLATSGHRPLDPRLLEEVLPASLLQRERDRADHTFFRAPELVRFARLWPGSDLFALGVTALVLATGQEPRDLYDQVQGTWNLEALESSLASRLLPLLEEAQGRRLQDVAAALRLFAGPAPPAPPRSRAAASRSATASAASGAIESEPPAATILGPKRLLIEALTQHYGPVVELLLESWSTTLLDHEEGAIRARLIAAGLGADDVDGALLQLRAAGVSALADPGPSQVVERPHGVGWSDPPALVALRREIGPVAEVVWSAMLERALVEDPVAAAALLRRSFVPEAVIARVLAEQAMAPDPPLPPQPLPQQPQPSPSASPQPSQAAPPAEPAQASTPLVVSLRALRSALLDVVGPMGERIFESVRGLPEGDRLGATLERLRSYGVSDSVLSEFALRVLRAS